MFYPVIKVKVIKVSGEKHFPIVYINIFIYTIAQNDRFPFSYFLNDLNDLDLNDRFFTFLRLPSMRIFLFTMFLQ